MLKCLRVWSFNSMVNLVLISLFVYIAGKFGTAVMSFFKFVRWLFFLNLFLMIVMLCVTTIPYVAFGSQQFEQTIDRNQSRFHDQALNCTNDYSEYSDEIFSQKSTFEKVLDFLQGTVGCISVCILWVTEKTLFEYI